MCCCAVLDMPPRRDVQQLQICRAPYRTAPWTHLKGVLCVFIYFLNSGIYLGHSRGCFAQEHIETVKQHLPLVFKNILDREHFEDKLYFRDPLTTNLNSFRCASPCSTPCCAEADPAWHASSTPVIWHQTPALISPAPRC